MKPYTTKKLEEFPDISDIQRDGRKGSIGRTPEKCGDFKPYVRSKQKKLMRRNMKRADRNKVIKIEIDNDDNRGE